MDRHQPEKLRPIKVLQVFDNLGMGGAETWIMEVLRYWHLTNKIQIDFLITGGKPSLFDEEATQLGARIYYLKYSRATLFHFIQHFRILLKSENYNAIHDHSDYSSGWHFLMGWRYLPKTLITHVHNAWINISVNYNVSRVRKISAYLGKTLTRHFATHICGTSREVLLSYGFKPNLLAIPQIAVLHCGFNTNKFRFYNSNQDDRVHILKEFNWDPGVKIVLFVGRLDNALQFSHPQNVKNSFFAVQILKLAKEMDKRVCLIMAGAGDQPRQQLELLIKSWNFSDSFRLVGIRKDIHCLMRAADLLLFPSTQEGLGMVAVEAQAAGLPVLASDAVPKECIVVKDLYHAISLDAPIEVWSDLLIKIIHAERPDPILSGQLVQASSFSIEQSAKSLEQIYSR